MVDETEFRKTLNAAFTRHCPFEKSIATHCVECSLAEKHNLAEREVVSCASDPAHRQCIRLLALLREKFTFAFGKLQIDGPLPHAQEMRMQCGGLKGIQYALDGNSDVGNVTGLLSDATQKFGDISELPFAVVLKRAMSDYQVR